MRDDYLWNRSGEPDQEISELEGALRPLRHNRRPPVFPVKPHRFPLWRSRKLAALAAVLVLTGVALLLRRTGPTADTPVAWDVTALAGSPRIESQTITALRGKLALGQSLETDDQSRASLTVRNVGQVEVEPHTRLRVIQARPGHSQLSLQRGTIHATIWAPPGVFAVDTPGAIAVDLGCRYTLKVEDTGAGLLQATSGWVGFKLGSRESFIPAGAACETRPTIGPGTPYFVDASSLFREALERFDFVVRSREERRSELTLVLAEARTRDAITIWHLLSRVDDGDRGSVYDRLAQLVPPPPAVTREGILQLDRRMLDLWWDQLGLGSASWWRIWEQSWSERQKPGP